MRARSCWRTSPCPPRRQWADEGRYPLVSALSRPVIVRHLVAAARRNGASAVADGATGEGNDQVRSEVGTWALAPDLEVLAPVRGPGMSREGPTRAALKGGATSKLGHYPGGTLIRANLGCHAEASAGSIGPGLDDRSFHSRPLGAFVGLLKAHGVRLLVDVRTVPRSRHNPQFDKESLPASLATAGIKYVHMPGLGGLRHARRDSVNTGWRNGSFRGTRTTCRRRSSERTWESSSIWQNGGV